MASDLGSHPASCAAGEKRGQWLLSTLLGVHIPEGLGSPKATASLKPSCQPISQKRKRAQSKNLSPQPSGVTWARAEGKAR